MSKTQSQCTSETFTQSNIKIGYFCLRGRAQIPRLLLEYFKISYEDLLFQNVKDWQNYKNKNQKDWPLLNLPFLIDGDVKITEAVPMCNYIINKYGNKEMLGKNIRDQAILNMFSLSIDNMGVSLVALCWLQGPEELLQKQKQKFWNEQLQEKMEALEIFVSKKPWMLGYLSLFDFSIYQLIHYIDLVFPGRVREFQRLLRIQKKVRELAEIQRYQRSEKSIKVFLPPNPMKNNRKY